MTRDTRNHNRVTSLINHHRYDADIVRRKRLIEALPTRELNALRRLKRESHAPVRLDRAHPILDGQIALARATDRPFARGKSAGDKAIEEYTPDLWHLSRFEMLEIAMNEMERGSRAELQLVNGSNEFSCVCDL